MYLRYSGIREKSYIADTWTVSRPMDLFHRGKGSAISHEPLVLRVDRIVRKDVSHDPSKSKFELGRRRGILNVHFLFALHCNSVHGETRDDWTSQGQREEHAYQQNRLARFGKLPLFSDRCQ